MVKTKKDKFKIWKETGEGKLMNKEFKNESKLYDYWRKEVIYNYDRKNKNEIREKLINYLTKENIGSILTLESHKFLFTKRMPECKSIVFENDKENYKDMKKTKPKNVKLFLGDIQDAEDLNINVDFVYLDFCRTWRSEKEVVNSLKETIKNSRFFAITLSLYDTVSKIDGDIQFFLINEIQKILGNLKVIYGETYGKWKGQMVTIFFEVLK